MTYAAIRTIENWPSTSFLAAGQILQRRCSCQTSRSNGAGCATCNSKQAPPVVHDVLKASGQSLDSNTRGFMEPRFGRDFSQVRVHTNSQADASAQAVHASAYTVGNNIVFRHNHYQPASSAGRTLLAHELTHVLQQSNRTASVQRALPGAVYTDSSISGTPINTRSVGSGGLQVGSAGDAMERDADRVARQVMQIDGSLPVLSVSPTSLFESPRLRRRLFDDGSSSIGRGTTLPYREATELAACVRIMGEENVLFCRQQVLGEDQPVAAPPSPPFIACEPNRVLTWADFTGAPSTSSSAFTAYDFPTATLASGGTRLRAVFNASRSFVRPPFGTPTDSALNGCDANVTHCESFFPPGSTGSSFALNSTPSASCPAAVRASSSVVASSKADCTGIIATECQRVAQAESDRLLRHEQLHFDLACVLVNKANGALAVGAALPAVQSALTAKDSALTTQYDGDTQSSCLAVPQATWATNIGAGLPAVTIP
jgi:hypothetical protein